MAATKVTSPRTCRQPLQALRPHKTEREIRVAAEATDCTNGLGDAPSLAFIETDLAALMLSDPARLGVKLKGFMVMTST